MAPSKRGIRFVDLPGFQECFGDQVVQLGAALAGKRKKSPFESWIAPG